MEKLRNPHEKTLLIKTDPVLLALGALFSRCEHVERALLFGSRARGDFSERSDYDVAVFGTLSEGDRLHLRSACREGLPTLHKIDVIFADEVTDEKFMQSIVKEGIAFYDKTAK